MNKTYKPNAEFNTEMKTLIISEEIKTYAEKQKRFVIDSEVAETPKA